MGWTGLISCIAGVGPVGEQNLVGRSGRLDGKDPYPYVLRI